MNNVMKQVLVWLVIALVVFTVFKQFDSRTGRTTSLAYSEFMDQAKSGRIKSAEIVTALGKIPGKGEAAWAERQLGVINNALSRGYVSAPQFTKLRQQVFAARAAKEGKNVSAWADDALGKGLISREECRMLKADPAKAP